MKITRFRKSEFAHAAAASLLALAFSACSGGGGGSGGSSSTTTSPQPQIDTTAPTATSAQTASSSIDKTAPVVVHFSESMKTSSLALGGKMASESNGGVWSKTVFDNDTLTISPQSGKWTSGENRDLTVNAIDVAGNALSAFSLNLLVKLAFDNFQAADVVIGQPDFFTGAGNSNGNVNGTPDASTLISPYGSPALASDGKLFVGDSGNNRVLAYGSIPTANHASAVFVLNQPNFTSMNSGTTQSSFAFPQQVAIAGNKMIVTEWTNNRLVVYNSIPTDGTAIPDVVVGQSGFTAHATTCDAVTTFVPETAVITPGGKLIVADSNHNRILIWNSIPAANGHAADVVLGQSDFTHCASDDDDQDGSGSNNPTARTLAYPSGIWADDSHIVVTDEENNRILIWNSIPTSNFQPANVVLGQADFTHRAANDDNQDGVTDTVPTARTINTPHDGVSSNGAQLAVVDSHNGRVLIWNTFPASSFQPADMVLGQSDFSHSTAEDDNQDGTSDAMPSARVLDLPGGVLFHDDKLLVSDSGNHRMLVFKSK